MGRLTPLRAFPRSMHATSTVPFVKPLPRNKTDVRLATVQIKGHVKDHVNLVANDILASAKAMNLRTSHDIRLPTTVMKFSLLRSPFVHKKHFDQFEKRTYNRLFEIYGDGTLSHDATKTVHFLRYLETNLLPAHGTARAKITMYSREVVTPTADTSDLHLSSPSRPSSACTA